MTETPRSPDEQYELCQKQFTLIVQKLDRIDTSLRGDDARPGFNERLRFIERQTEEWSRLKWILITTSITSLGLAITVLITR